MEPPTLVELFRHTHQRRKDNSWVDEKSEQVNVINHTFMIFIFIYVQKLFPLPIFINKIYDCSHSNIDTYICLCLSFELMLLVVLFNSFLSIVVGLFLA